MHNMGGFLSLSVTAVIRFHEVRNSLFKTQKNISFHLVSPSSGSGPLALQKWNLRNFQQNGVGIYFKSMAGPHYSLSSCSLLEFSLDPGALLVHLCVLSEKEEFVCFVNGLMEQRDRIVALSLEGKGYSF